MPARKQVKRLSTCMWAHEDVNRPIIGAGKHAKHGKHKNLNTLISQQVIIRNTRLRKRETRGARVHVKQAI